MAESDCNVPAQGDSSGQGTTSDRDTDHGGYGRMPCAAFSVSSKDRPTENCPKVATKVCGHCSLVAYCSKECQVAHWKEHKKDCKQAALAKGSWVPRWCKEQRAPSFMGGPPASAHNAVGSAEKTKYLWGNTPAFDLLKLRENEGEAYTGDLRLCYAASGDIRNAMRTIVDIPSSCTSTVEVLLNDREPVVALRNIVLLLFLSEPDKQLAIDAIIHYWYSAALRPPHIELLKKVVLPFFQDVCRKIQGKEYGSVQSKRFAIGEGSLRVVLTAGHWEWMKDFLERSVDSKKAFQSRRDVCLARIDHIDRHLASFTMHLHRRLAKMHFREQGVLLPFGESVAGFDQPNLTLYDEESLWVLNDSSDPLESFSDADINRFCSLAASGTSPSNDLYGRLYRYLQHQLSTTYDRVHKGIQLTVLAQDASSLRTLCLDWPRFDRIDTSNIVDLPYLGVHSTLWALRPLLNTENPRAAIVSLFMNAVHEQNMRTGEVAMQAAGQKAITWLGRPSGPMWMGGFEYSPAVLRSISAAPCFVDKRALWEDYVVLRRVVQAAADLRMKMRAEHRVVPQWPCALTKKRLEPGALEQLEDILTSGDSPLSRYVEWEAM